MKKLVKHSAMYPGSRESFSHEYTFSGTILLSFVWAPLANHP